MSEKIPTDHQEELAGKTAIITGAASGIGLAIARRFVREGAAVALFDINDDNLANATKELLEYKPGAEIFPVHCNITDEAEVVRSVKTTADHFGRLNIAVNNAGVSISVPSEECTLEQWNWIMNINCTGSFLVSREAIKVFKTQADGGVLVYINSDNALKPSKHFLAYNASKAAVLQMARTIANEFGAYNIRANSVLPGAVFGASRLWTPEMRQDRARVHGFHPDQLEEEYKKNNALGVIIDPDEIAELVVFLSSDRSAKMTGNALVIDGGGLGGYVR